MVAQNDIAKKFKAQLFAYGEFEDPRDYTGEGTITIDEAFVDQIVKNFEANVIGAPVQVPYGTHDRDLSRSVGVVQALHKEADGLYGTLLITNEEAIDRIERGETVATSPAWEFNFISTKVNKDGTRNQYGATLMHAAIVDVPHFAELKNLVAAQKTEKSVDKLYMSMFNAGMNQDLIDQIKGLTDEQLAELGLAKAETKNEEEEEKEQPKEEPTPPADGEEEEKGQESKVHEHELATANKRIAQLENTALADRKARYGAEVQATLARNKVKFNAVSVKQVEARLKTMQAAQDLNALEAERNILDAIVEAVSAGPDVVTMGEVGSSVGEPNEGMSDAEVAQAAKDTGLSEEKIREMDKKAPKIKSHNPEEY